MKNFISLRYVEVIIYALRSKPHLCKFSLAISASERPTPREMLKHSWLLNAASKKLNMARWIRTIQGIEERPR